MTVPGCVDGWMALHERFGRSARPGARARVGYARDGFPASPMLAASVPVLPDAPGRGPAGADGDAQDRRDDPATRRRPALEAIVSDGRAGFYEGEFGEGCSSSATASTPRPTSRAPGATGSTRSASRRSTTSCGASPELAGLRPLSSAWIADGLALPDDPADPLWAHLLVEASKQAGRDRPEVLHDGADGARARRAPRGSDRGAVRSTPTTRPRGRCRRESGDTTALCVVDGEGIGVSLIQSNASGFGSHLFEPATGINLHNRGSASPSRKGHPAEYAPGRRPPHTLTPGLVTNLDGRLAAVLGTMGGDSQPQVLLQLLARTFPQRRVAGPQRSRRVGFAWSPRSRPPASPSGQTPRGRRSPSRARRPPCGRPASLRAVTR